MTLGGGVDLQATRRFSVRLCDVDYAKTSLGDNFILGAVHRIICACRRACNSALRTENFSPHTSDSQRISPLSELTLS